MKITLALTALSTKLIMLLCVSCVGFMGTVQESMAAQSSPCHQEIIQAEEATETCEMCETALEAWEANAIAISAVEFINDSDFPLSLGSIMKEFILELKPLEGVYQTYYPPPQVLLKAVTPNTKTIVLLS